MQKEQNNLIKRLGIVNNPKNTEKNNQKIIKVNIAIRINKANIENIDPVYNLESFCNSENKIMKFNKMKKIYKNI